MVKRREAIPEESAHSQEANTVRPPPMKLHVTAWTLPTSKAMHRIHQDIYQGDQFNPGVKGNALFSPITDAKGSAIPTLYAAYTFDAALMESVFHDVSHASGYKHYDKNKLNQQVHSTVKVSQNLVLADLSSVALRKLGVQRKQLIDSEKDQYPSTREWAQAIHNSIQTYRGYLGFQGKTIRPEP